MMLASLRRVGWNIGGTPILREVSFDVAPGEFIALVGRNGAGKSTLLNIVAGIAQPSEGEWSLDGRPAATWPARARARIVAHLPQILRADLPFTADQVVLMGRYAHARAWLDADEDRQEVERAMAACACLAFRSRRLSTLSGGERQRVLLAACLAQQPKLLLLDEPAVFLDLDQQLQTFRLLRREVDRGVACIAVTHDVNLALRFCTRLLVLSGGTLARDLSIGAAAAQPEWLSLLSNEIAMSEAPDGGAWVSYR